ncbi:MAG: ATP-dependent sacrificial sulfur transferase LarE [Archaeoglobaceae archaeon]
MHLSEVVAKLEESLRGFKRVLVAFSGGVDSATLAAVCKMLGKDVLAVTVLSQVTPSREIKAAKAAAREIGVKHEFLHLDVLTEEFRRNDKDRCYFCKRRILEKLVEVAKARGFDVVLEGTNASDLKEHRPGFRAARELGVRSPWAELGVTKEQIRSLAKELGFSFHDRPSLACLATRIPFGVGIDEAELRMIDAAENALIEVCGVRQVRVRNYRGVAIVEVERGELGKVFEKADIVREKLKELGFKAVLLDLDGYASGAHIHLQTLRSISSKTA